VEAALSDGDALISAFALSDDQKFPIGGYPIEVFPHLDAGDSRAS
jgi:hypothetical protein